MKLTWLTTLLLCVALPALAQESRQEILNRKKRDKAAALSSYELSKAEARFLSLEKIRFPRNIFSRGFRGVRPLIGGLPSGSGFAGGVGYLHDPDLGLFRFETNALHSTRGFTELDAEVTFPSARLGRRVRMRVNTAHQDYTALRFFGLGNDSDESDRSFFGQTNTIVGAGLTADVGKSLALSWNVERWRVETDASDRSPSLQTLFEPASTPGSRADDRDYNVYGIGAEWQWLDRTLPSAGVVLRARAERYDDRENRVFDFSRFIGDVRAYVPLGPRNRMLAMRLRTSHSNADARQIPFYLMETIGGARTLRGYREYRFRDARNILLNVEYRWEVWTYVDFAVFLDAGKVFAESSETDFTGLHTGYGFGMRAHGPGGTILRVDVARSREGYRLHIGAGPSF